MPDLSIIKIITAAVAFMVTVVAIHLDHENHWSWSRAAWILVLVCSVALVIL